MQQVIRANFGLLVAGLLTFVLMGAGQSMYGPAIPAFARAFGLGPSEPALLISAHWVGAAFGVGGMFLRGHLITPRVVVAAMAAGAALVALGPVWSVTLLGAVFFGAGYGASTVIFNRRFLTRFGARGPAMVSFVNAIFGLGAISAPLIYVWLGSQPQLAYGLVAGLAVVTFLLAGSAGQDGVIEQVGAAEPFRLRPGILLFGMTAIAVEACLIGLGPTALIASGASEDRAAELLSMFFVAFLMVRLGLVVISNLLPPFTMLILALGLAGVCALGAATVSAGPFFVMMGVFTGMFFPSFFVCATLQMGHDPRVTPTIIAAGLAGGITSPLILGLVMARYGDGVFFWVIGVVALMMALVGMGFMARMNRHNTMA
ncbi:MAG: MFS transporter [Paracoccaceae bacterium]